MTGSPRRVGRCHSPDTPLPTLRKMHASTLTALSPLDGRYAAKLDPLPAVLGDANHLDGGIGSEHLEQALAYRR